jgi:hypothetical protein
MVVHGDVNTVDYQGKKNRTRFGSASHPGTMVGAAGSHGVWYAVKSG